MATRELDLVIFGASGFTGGLTAEYLALHAPAGFRWALAGRDLGRLDTVRRRLAAVCVDCAELPLLRADLDDYASIEAMARRARVVLTTVGPYALLGEPLLKACAAMGTHYADLTGEPEFVALAQARYDQLARDSGAKIINCAGFDSIPHDFGAWFTVRQLPSSYPVELRGYVRAGGSLSGGTWHSAVQALARWRQWRDISRQVPRPALARRRVGALPARPHHVSELDRWACPFPTIDPQVVQRSARALDDYGPDFRYGHFAAADSVSTLLAGAAVVGGIAVGAQLPPLRKLLLTVRKPGHGPSESERERGWFRVTFVGRAGGREVVTAVSGGDPGYGETAKMLAETGLCLALDALPRSTGVLTPVVALGEPMLARLRAANIRFEVLRS